MSDDRLALLRRIRRDVTNLIAELEAEQSGEAGAANDNPGDANDPDDMVETWVAADRLGYPQDTIRKLAREKGVGEKVNGRWLISIRAAKAALRLR